VNNFVDGLALVYPVGMKIENSSINRALMYSPNAAKADIDAVDVSTNVGVYGYLVDVNDVMVFDLPITNIYVDAVKSELNKIGERIPTYTEKMRILLYITRANRMYGMDSVIDESEWDY
jgi:hypothetical protein